jgi:ketosteroid isomerase-like protein
MYSAGRNLSRRAAYLPRPQREDHVSQANVALIQSLYAAFGRGEIATIIAALAPDMEWRLNGSRADHPLLGTWKGPQGVQAFFGKLAEIQDFSEFSPREFFSAGDRVFVLGHYAATMRKTGRKAASDWVHIFTVQGGKVAAFLEFTDTAEFARAWNA